MQPVHLVIFSTDAEQVNMLKGRFAPDTNVSVVLGNGPDVTKRMKLDAMWMTPMQASYFGVTQPLPPHVARVFPMPLTSREKGMPSLIVAGVALLPYRTYAPKYLATISAKALADAVAEYNALNEAGILRVGSNPANLGLDDLGAGDSFRAVKEAFALSSDRGRQTQQRQTQSA